MTKRYGPQAKMPQNQGERAEAELRDVAKQSYNVPAAQKWHTFKASADPFCCVQDGEVSATRWIPPDQREREQAERAAEEARRQEAAAGNIVERALQQMMHGTLAATAAAAVAKELEKPDWMAGDPAAFTAEQIAAVSRVQ